MASRARPPLRILAGDRVLPGGAHRGDPPRARRHLLPGHHRPRLLRSAPLPGAGAGDAAPLRGVGTDGGAGSDRGEAAILTTHNTFTKRKEPFAPLEEGTARLYVCGPNLYGPVHVGHAFSYAFFDVVRRYLEYRGYQVIHVQNFTDIEDRIIERAHHYPRASEVIPQIIEIIQGLIARGHAYAVDGDVYYRVTSFPRYGHLSGRSLGAMQAGARVQPGPRQEHPMELPLWKKA